MFKNPNLLPHSPSLHFSDFTSLCPPFPIHPSLLIPCAPIQLISRVITSQFLLSLSRFIITVTSHSLQHFLNQMLRMVFLCNFITKFSGIETLLLYFPSCGRRCTEGQVEMVESCASITNGMIFVQTKPEGKNYFNYRPLTVSTKSSIVSDN